MINKIKIKLNSNSGRSSKALFNIGLSLIAKGVSILCSLLIVPLTLSYLNPSNYGIWLTLSSIIGWISFFDLGLGNGFRNKFAEAKAKGDNSLASQYVSTTYITIFTIVMLIFLIIMIANFFIDWSTIFKIDQCYKDELRKVFAIVSTFFCINMVANIFSMLLTADQKPGVTSIINAIGSIVSVIVIKILTCCSEGNLVNFALYYSGIPCAIMLISSLFAFNFTKYRQYRPSWTKVDFSLIKNILNLGVKFFLIYICLLVIFHIINIVLSREFGPEAVTQYNVSHKYFNIIYMVMIIVITPFWSAFTDAYHKQDFIWMKKVLRKLELCWFAAFLGGFIMLIFSPMFFKFWIGDKVYIPNVLNVCMLVYVLTQTLGSLYMHLINGIGTIKLQFIIYIIFALISLPLLTLSCRIIGIQGILIIPSLVYLIQAIIGKIQLSKIINKKASGIWNK